MGMTGLALKDQHKHPITLQCGEDWNGKLASMNLFGKRENRQISITSKIKPFLKWFHFMAFFFFRNALKEPSLSYSNIGISTLFWDAGITDVDTWPQLKVCLLERILEPVISYTDAYMMIIDFCLKGKSKASWLSSKHWPLCESWGKGCN